MVSLGLPFSVLLFLLCLVSNILSDDPDVLLYEGHSVSSGAASIASKSVFMPWAIIPPKITLLSHSLNGDTIDIAAGSTIHLRCTGQRQMVWIFPNNMVRPYSSPV